MGPSLIWKSEVFGEKTSVPMRSAREEVRRELHPREARAHGRGKGFHGQRLGEAGDAFEQNVTVAEKTEEQAVEKVALADDDAAQLASQRLDPLAGLLRGLGDFLGGHAGAEERCEAAGCKGGDADEGGGSCES